MTPRRALTGPAARLALVLLAVALLTWLLAPLGVRARWATLDATRDGIGLRGDAENAHDQGRRTLRALRSDKAARDFDAADTRAAVRARLLRDVGRVDDGRSPVDYPPLRLTVMTFWAQHLAAHDLGDAPIEARVEPLVRMNVGVDALGALATWAGALLWLRRGAGQSWAKAVGMGWLAGACYWFSPALIAGGYGYPQWDGWGCAAYALAFALGAARCWGAMGIVVGVGALLKGQVLLVAPALVVWAGLSAGPVGLVALASGAVVGALGSTCWLWGPDLEAVPRATVALPAFAGLAVFALQATFPGAGASRRAAAGWSAATLTCGATAAGLAWFGPGFDAPRAALIGGGVALLGVVTAGVRAKWEAAAPFGALPRLGVPSRGTLTRLYGSSRAAIAAVALVAGVVASTLPTVRAAVRVGYPDKQHNVLTTGAVGNVPGILQHTYRLRNDTRVALPWAGDRPVELDLRKLLQVCAMALCATCGAALAWQQRAGGANLLVAACAPWVVVFALMPQMHERYLVWGATSSALAVAAGLRWAPLHLGVALSAGAMVTATFAYRRPDLVHPWLLPLREATPGLGWAVVVLAAACVQGSWTTTSRGRASGSAAERAPLSS